MNVINVLEKCAKDYQSKPAVIFGETQISFAQLRDKVFSFSQSLLKLRVKRGDKVAIYLPYWLEYIISYLAIWSVGACAVPLDFMLTEDEIVSCLSHSETKILITKHKANVSFTNLKATLPLLKNIISCRSKEEGVLSFEELLTQGENQAPEVEIKDKEYAIIF